MTLDPNKPEDQVQVSELPSYIREGRVAINAFEDAGGEVDDDTLNLTVGTTALVVGTNLSVSKIELIRITSSGTCVIDEIRGGREGQIKIFLMMSNTISWVDGLKSDGHLYLNQLPVGTTFNAQEGDVLVLTNIGGNGSTTYGYWQEMYRLNAVK